MEETIFKPIPSRRFPKTFINNLAIMLVEKGVLDGGSIMKEVRLRNAEDYVPKAEESVYHLDVCCEDVATRKVIHSHESADGHIIIISHDIIIESDDYLGAVHSKEELAARIYEYAVKAGQAIAKKGGLTFVDLTREKLKRIESELEQKLSS